MNKHELESRFPENHIIMDDRNNPSVMVYVEKFYLSDVIDGASHIPHPAFVVDGKELDGIYISKFQNVILDGRACSLPDRDPAIHVDFDSAVKSCSSKGKGFHLMTAMEWGAISLWCRKNGWIPFGNNDMGKDIRDDRITAKISHYNPEKPVCRTATGTGPIEWSHNRNANGIYDLNGNVWEWVGGMRLVFGELQILPYNGVSGGYRQDAFSQDWRAIDGVNGGFLIPDGHGTTKNSVKLDFVHGRWTYVTNENPDRLDHFRFCDFADVSACSNICEPARELLYALGCLPYNINSDYQGVSFYANNGAAERIPFRGGRWGQGRNAGIFKTCLDDPRSYCGDAVGFRSTYYAE